MGDIFWAGRAAATLEHVDVANGANPQREGCPVVPTEAAKEEVESSVKKTAEPTADRFGIKNYSVHWSQPPAFS